VLQARQTKAWLPSSAKPFDLGLMWSGVAVDWKQPRLGLVRYSRDYVEEEREAAAVRAGIHGHTCQPAWQWRVERR
jgi:hypothetical protein